MKKTDTKKLVGVALFTAIVVVLQLVGSFIKLGTFSISLVLVPIVIGAALYGVGAGTWLGFIFGFTVLVSGDAAAFLAINPVGAVIVCIAKGMLAGLCAGLVYKAIENKNSTVAVAASAIVCPVVNTGVFLIGCALFFMETIRGWAEAFGFGSNVAAYMIIGLVGVNFLLEMLVNVVLSPVIVRLIHIGKKSKIN
ncbi:MAG: ECF transporter S component [Firmicutes bacterium]|nr:ECF transporter S component [Bacillota bacterium]